MMAHSDARSDILIYAFTMESEEEEREVYFHEVLRITLLALQS